MGLKTRRWGAEAPPLRRERRVGIRPGARERGALAAEVGNLRPPRAQGAGPGSAQRRGKEGELEPPGGRLPAGQGLGAGAGSWPLIPGSEFPGPVPGP